MVTFACAVVAYLRSLFLPRHKLALEAVALRQQLAVFQRKQPRPKLDRLDRLFWIVLRRHVRASIEDIEAGKFVEYEGREGLKKLAAGVKARGRKLVGGESSGR